MARVITWHLEFELGAAENGAVDHAAPADMVVHRAASTAIRLAHECAISYPIALFPSRSILAVAASNRRMLPTHSHCFQRRLAAFLCCGHPLRRLLCSSNFPGDALH